MKLSKSLVFTAILGFLSLSGCWWASEPPALLISEIGSAAYNSANAARWIEVYNSGGSTVDLSTITLKTGFTDGSYGYISGGTFDLPSHLLKPGAYVALSVEIYPAEQHVNENYNFIQIQNGNVPYWREYGYVELLDGSKSIDFVRFGSSSVSLQPSQGSFTGYGPSLPATSDSYGYSLSRNSVVVDTDSGNDFELSNFATPGLANDIMSSPDIDEDGIPDYVEEAPGRLLAGMPLYEWGARTNQPDIFIHIDYMSSSDLGIIPQEEALDKVKTAFANEGYAVHFDTGTLYANYNLSNTSHSRPYASSITLGSGAASDIYKYKADYFPIERKWIFHYAFFGSVQAGAYAGSSGLAEYLGNDLLITLGGYGLNRNNANSTNLLINYQASTFMHELGHNLGLLHGGNSNDNYKPNYMSIMNYMYQLDGLPDESSLPNPNIGDRYYFYQFLLNSSTESYPNWDSTLVDSLSDLTLSPYSPSFRIDFSHGDSNDLNESALQESIGWGKGPVDFNAGHGGPGISGGTIAEELDDDDFPDGIALTDFNDWDNLVLFPRNIWWDLNGNSRSAVEDPSFDDRQPIVPERPLR
jgi:hypothetical protein